MAEIWPESWKSLKSINCYHYRLFHNYKVCRKQINGSLPSHLPWILVKSLRSLGHVHQRHLWQCFGKVLDKYLSIIKLVALMTRWLAVGKILFHLLTFHSHFKCRPPLIVMTEFVSQTTFLIFFYWTIGRCQWCSMLTILI